MTGTEDDFAERLAAPTPTPGGGAAAARTGRHATALLRMVTSLTLAKAAPDGTDDPALGTVREIASRAREVGDRLAALESADMDAFEAYLAALRLPRGTDEEKAHRRESRLAAARRATEVPLETMERALETMGLARRLVELSATLKLRAESDVGGAVELAHAAARAAELNVRVNLPGLGDDRGRWEERFRPLVERLDGEYPRLRREILDWLAR